MIVETKATVVVGALVAVGTAVAWATGAMSTAVNAVQSSTGIVIQADLLVQLVMTAVIVGIAFGMVRTKVDGMSGRVNNMSHRFDSFEKKLDGVASKVERFAERLDYHADEIDRLRDPETPPRPRRAFGRQPSSDAEDV